eukprot:COSAG05_NODE_793_length_7295_cov_2.666481_1_plen_48_part_00
MSRSALARVFEAVFGVLLGGANPQHFAYTHNLGYYINILHCRHTCTF